MTAFKRVMTAFKRVMTAFRCRKPLRRPGVGEERYPV